MKRVELVLAVSIAMLACVIGVAAQSDSLGDVARAARKEKRPTAKKSYTNDNLPSTTPINVVGEPKAGAEEEPVIKTQDSNEKQDGDKKTAQKQEKATQSKEPQDEQEWHDQIAEQKKQISDLQHELDLLQREYKLQVADYYADAGAQLRDPKAWGEQEAKYRADIAEKQKQIDEAKAQLQDMEEEVRKAGMSSSVSE